MLLPYRVDVMHVEPLEGMVYSGGPQENYSARR